MELKEIKNIFHKELNELYPKEEIDSFFFLMIDHYLHLERFVLALQPDLVLSKEEEQPLFEGLTALAKQEPIQHILGVTTFMDMDFKVNEDVLIPRPETEELVRWIVEDVKTGEPNKPLKILDIGTGSGCLAISLAVHLPAAKVFAIDISDKALTVAKQNSENLKADVTFIEADILNTEVLEQDFDIIVSNPPYVRMLEKEEMQQNVLGFEPHLALFVENDDPLIFYNKITSLAVTHLRQEGRLYFEINQYLGKEMQQLLEEYHFKNIELRKDMFGNDRMIKGEVSH